MKLQKKDILEALKTITAPGAGENMVDSGAVTNVLTFGDEVIVDITINNPTLQARKKAEVDIMKTIHDKVFEKAQVKVNVKVTAPPKEETVEIKGKAIPGFLQNQNFNGVIIRCPCKAAFPLKFSCSSYLVLFNLVTAMLSL